MQILTLNSGSSSIKFSFFDAASDPTHPRSVFEGEVSGIGSHQPKAAFRDAEARDLTPQHSLVLDSLEDAIAFVDAAVTSPRVPKLDAIGYRVVHPGAHLRDHQRITPEVLAQLRDAAAFAPLHDPSAVKIIEEMQRRFPEATHFACFDTVFHQTMPPEATAYPLPPEYAAQGVHRYGFHGLSCESVVVQLRASGLPFPRRLAIAHLGGGSSVTALLDGASVDTSMGLTPTGGVPMATRSGDLDPGLVVYLLRQNKDSANDVETLLNHDSGLAALSGISGDMRELRAASMEGNPRATLALQIFTRAVRKTLGGYLALLGGLDAIVFTGGIGENDPATRAEILAGLNSLGIALDLTANSAQQEGLRRVSPEHTPTAIYIVPAEEDLMIARHVARMSQSAQPSAS